MFRFQLCESPSIMGQMAAGHFYEVINEAITQKGKARVVLSTGISQVETLSYLSGAKIIDWTKVEVFHLDEYIGIPESHPASFRKYLKDRFLSKVNIGKAYLIDGDDDPQKVIARLTEEIRKEPIDIGLVGIGENAHIAFNDPPADFDTQEAFICVTLSDSCKQQQVREGWFADVADVPPQAITMTVHQIMQCEHILSCVPYAVKAPAVRDTLELPVSNTVPASILKTHLNYALFVDRESSSLSRTCKNIIDLTTF